MLPRLSVCVNQFFKPDACNLSVGSTSINFLRFLNGSASERVLQIEGDIETAKIVMTLLNEQNQVILDLVKILGEDVYYSTLSALEYWGITGVKKDDFKVK